MDLNSPLFDRIRIKPSCDEPRETEGPVCEHPACKAAGQYRAPKGRDREGQYWQFCLEHVREYNASYNYFAGHVRQRRRGLSEGRHHRPSPDLGHGRERGRPARAGRRPGARGLGLCRSARRPAGRELQGQRRPPARAEAPRYTGAVRRALDILGLDETADGPAIKAQYKALVKRFHPDANGGDRSFEERLRDIIKAHDTLKSAGLC